MKKREFLAMGGAVPLMLAGCGGNGSGSAPVRLVNASVGYATAPGLGFMVDTTQAVSDVLYGSASPFETVQAGSVTTALTVPATSSDGTVATVSSTTRSLSKDSRYSLIAYGFKDELKSVLLTESTVNPDSGKANINVLNTSVDIGAVDVYLSTTSGKDLSLATLIATNTNGVTQSTFFSILPGAYYITVVGTGSVATGNIDFRFQSPSTITLVDQQIVTIILTPGASGTLANAIVLTQGTASTSGTPVNFPNTTARLRVVTAVPSTTSIAVAGVLAAASGSQASNYAVVNTGTVPILSLNGTAQPPLTGTLLSGGDYTLLVYTDTSGANLGYSLIQDDNTAPVSASGVKYRLINLAYNNTGVSLRMTVNSLNVASAVTFGTASAYAEVTQPTQVNSLIEVFSGADELKSRTQAPVASAVGIFTEVVVSFTGTDDAPVVKDFLLSATGTAITS